MTTILLVEPNAHFLGVGADVLMRGGYEVISASTADDAMSFVSRFDPHLILLDGAYANADVLEALAKSTVRPLTVIFTFPQGQGARVMAMLEASSACDSVEVIGFVEKPFAADVLLTTVDEGVRAAIDAAEGYDALAEATQRIHMREDETQIAPIMPAPFSIEPDGAQRDGRLGEPPSGILYRALGLDVPRGARFDSRTSEPELPRAMPEASPKNTRAHELAERIIDQMPERYPLHPAQMCAIASACEDALNDDVLALGAVAEGTLSGVPPFQVLQLAENLAPTAKVVFTRADKAVEIYIRDHTVVHARAKNVRLSETDQIVYEGLSWTEGRFAVLTNVSVPRETVALPMAALLLEGLRRVDEVRRDSSVPRRASASS